MKASHSGIVVWLLPGVHTAVNSSHPKRVVEGGCLAGKVWKRRCITGIIRGHAKVLWEPKDKNKQQSSLSRMEVSAPHMAYMLLSGISSSMMTSSSWFFILPLTKIASLHPDVFHGFWAQFLRVIDNIHCGPTDFTHHTSAGVRKYTLPWPKEAKTLHRHLTDYKTAQTRETRVDRTCAFYQGQVNARHNNSVRRMFKRIPKENYYKKFWRSLKKNMKAGVKIPVEEEKWLVMKTKLVNWKIK